MNLWHWLSLLLAVVNERRRDRQSRRREDAAIARWEKRYACCTRSHGDSCPELECDGHPSWRVGRQRDADSTPRRTSP